MVIVEFMALAQSIAEVTSVVKDLEEALGYTREESFAVVALVYQRETALALGGCWEMLRNLENTAYQLTFAPGIRVAQPVPETPRHRTGASG